jgi:hypothetical protein
MGEKGRGLSTLEKNSFVLLWGFRVPKETRFQLERGFRLDENTRYVRDNGVEGELFAGELGGGEEEVPE